MLIISREKKNSMYYVEMLTNSRIILRLKFREIANTHTPKIHNTANNNYN